VVVYFRLQGIGFQRPPSKVFSCGFQPLNENAAGVPLRRRRLHVEQAAPLGEEGLEIGPLPSARRRPPEDRILDGVRGGFDQQEPVPFAIIDDDVGNLRRGFQGDTEGCQSVCVEMSPVARRDGQSMRKCGSCEQAGDNGKVRSAMSFPQLSLMASEIRRISSAYSIWSALSQVSKAGHCLGERRLSISMPLRISPSEIR